MIPVAWILLLLIVPLAAMLAWSVATRGPAGEIEWTLTLANFARLAGFDAYGWTRAYLVILGNTLLVSAITTLVEHRPRLPPLVLHRAQAPCPALPVAGAHHHPVLHQPRDPHVRLDAAPGQPDAAGPHRAAPAPGRALRGAVPFRVRPGPRHGLQLAALRRAAPVHERREAGLGDRGGEPGPVLRAPCACSSTPSSRRRCRASSRPSSSPSSPPWAPS